jgi:glycosyltransferase involved in cell wall biosynthesis
MASGGINLVGYLNHVIGLGESARQFAGVLRAAGIPHALAALDLGSGVPRLPAAGAPWLSVASLPYETTVVWANPDRYGIDLDLALLTSRRLVGRWAWELPELPAPWAAAAEPLAEIWTASRFVRDAVARGVRRPVRIMGMAVEAPPAPELDRGQWGVPGDEVLFLFVFDHHSIAARKNPLGVIDAFTRAFPAAGRASLLIKSINAANVPQRAAELASAAAAHPHVQVVDVALPDAGRLSLLAGCDCYVSLHRSEGFGMTIAEAMAYGRPVIATGYGGCLDFLDSSTGFPVAWRPGRVPEGTPVYPAGGAWAEPDIEHAAALMAQVAGEPAMAAAQGARARQRIAQHHSPQAVGRAAVRALGELESAA